MIIVRGTRLTDESATGCAETANRGASHAAQAGNYGKRRARRRGGERGGGGGSSGRSGRD